MRFPAAETTVLDWLGRAWPVGSVYVSAADADPALLMGFGVWEAFGAGRVLVGLDAAQAEFDTLGETGGAKESSAVVSHTHPVNVTDPQHSHTQRVNSATTGGLSGYTPDTSTNTAAASGYSTLPASTGITATTSEPAGAVPSFSLLNPYVVVRFWRRVS